MGCVSSSLLSREEDFSQIGGSAFTHHIVSLTSTTYGLLTLDPPPSPPSSATVPPPPRRTLGSLFPIPLSEPETINSWDLMSDLDSDRAPSFRFFNPEKPNSAPFDTFLSGFEAICPPNGENKLVMYSTTLRGVRKTFEDCNAVRAAIQGLGFVISERDISMDKGFRDELRELLKDKDSPGEFIPPRLFVKGRYIGGVNEVLRIVEEGSVGKLLHGLPKLREGNGGCDGCGGVGFLPCFTCHGSCKTVKEESGLTKKKSAAVVVRCGECNENGLVLCPICS